MIEFWIAATLGPDALVLILGSATILLLLAYGIFVYE